MRTVPRHDLPRDPKTAACAAFACLVAVVAAFTLFAPRAYADTVVFASSTNIVLTSPSTTLIVASGSIADTVIVGATNVTVSLSASTGGAFTLLSASYDLDVATLSSGGTVSSTCAGGIVTLVLSQAAGSATYTVMPTTQNCSTASPPILSNITAESITSRSAVVAWTTNINADSSVSYGTAPAYGATSTDAASVTSHGVTLSNLQHE